MAFKLLEIIQSNTAVDITNIILPDKFTVTAERITAKEARAPINGTLYSGLIAEKRTIAFTIRPVAGTRYLNSDILGLFAGEYLYINYEDAFLGWRTNIKVVPSSISFPALYRGDEVWCNSVDIVLREV